MAPRGWVTWLKSRLSLSILLIVLMAASVASANFTILYFSQPNCPGCKYMEEYVFKDLAVAKYLSNFTFIKIDARERPSFEAVTDGAVVVAEGGTVTYLENGTSKSSPLRVFVVTASGWGRFPVLATPTVAVLEYVNGTPHVRGYLVGAVPPDSFIEFLEIATERRGEYQQGGYFVAPLVLAAALGVISATSPCIVVPLALATSRRRLRDFAAGAYLGYAAWSGAIALGAPGFVLDKYSASVMLIALGAIYLFEGRLHFTRVQTAFYKFSRGVDLLTGFFSPFISLPCLLPFIGLTGVLAMALFANTLERFFTIFIFGTAHITAVVLLTPIVRRISKLRKVLVTVLIVGSVSYILLQS
ncbi:MAG: thioredoxin family protein [Pyrobaculum sp.]